MVGMQRNLGDTHNFSQYLTMSLNISALRQMLKPLKRFPPNVRIAHPTVETVG